MRATACLVLVLLTGVVTTAAATGGPASAGSGRGEASRDYMRGLAEETSVPGLAWAVVDDGVVRTDALGADGAGNPVDDDTPFLWGSVSKPVTAAAVMQLVERSHITLDDPVVDHVPWLPVHRRSGTEVTVRHLLTHTSSFSPAAGLRLADRDRNGPDALETVARGLELGALAARPGGEHRYSAVNYLLLGALVEEVTGQRYARNLERQVLDPAGMTRVVATADQAADRLPSGHRLIFGRAWTFDGPYDEAGVPFGYLGGSHRRRRGTPRTLPRLSASTNDDGEPASSAPSGSRGSWLGRSSPPHPRSRTSATLSRPESPQAGFSIPSHGTSSARCDRTRTPGPRTPTKGRSL